MRHILDFVVTNRSGVAFTHYERFNVSGLAKVRVRAKNSETISDHFGVIEKYHATSSKPFIVCVISNHTWENQGGGETDDSGVYALESKVQ